MKTHIDSPWLNISPGTITMEKALNAATNTEIASAKTGMLPPPRRKPREVRASPAKRQPIHAMPRKYSAITAKSATCRLGWPVAIEQP